jgi:hypothetical protein
MSIVLGATLFCLAMVGGAVSTAAAQPEFPSCQTTPAHSVGAHLESPGRWTYDHHVVWCVEDGKITWWESVVVAGESAVCVREGEENTPTPVPNSNDLTIKNVSTFLCSDDSGRQPKYENPWSIVRISPSGGSWIHAKGVD